MYRRKISICSRFAKKLKNVDAQKQKLISIALQKFVNYEDSGLRIHKLQGTYKGFWSFDADYDLRIIYSISKNGTIIIHNLENFGTHKELYGK